jgi:ketosteroid isomerase-like protein
MTTDAHLQLAERLFGAIMAGDIDAVRSLYAPDAVIWHNIDRAEQTADQNLRVLQWVVQHVRNLRYEEICRQRTANGFVQQHVLRGTAPNGQALDVPACMVGTVRDGRIVRLEEYLDSGHLAALLAEAS